MAEPDATLVLSNPYGDKGPGDEVTLPASDAKLLVQGGIAVAKNKTAQKALDSAPKQQDVKP